MPSTLTIADVSDLVDQSIRDIWIKGSEKESRMFEQYYNVVSGVTDYYLKDSSISGLGYASRVVENAVIVAETPVQGFDKTYTQVNFGKILPVTKVMWFFGIQKRKLTAIADELRAACADMRELRCAERLVNSFSTNYTVSDDAGNWTATTTGGDGVAMISASHTREDGGTDWGNRITDGSTVNMDWEYDALKAAHRTAALIRNPKGKKMNINLDTWVGAKNYTNHHRAVEMLGAMNKGWMPGTAEHDSAGVITYKILALPWIESNTDYWWMFDSSKKNDTYGLQYKESQGITLDGPNIVFRTEEIQYRSTVMFDIGFNDSRNWVGSKNTNAA